MPRSYKSQGYDPLVLYSEHELEQMYVKEGKSPEEAARLARDVHLAMDAMNAKERRLWDKVRRSESRFPYIDNNNEDSLNDTMKSMDRGHGADE